MYSKIWIDQTKKWKNKMPYSVEEMKHPTRDEVIHKEIVIMDNTGSPEFGDFDVHVSLSTEEDVVYISQTHELESRSDLIILTQHITKPVSYTHLTLPTTPYV